MSPRAQTVAPELRGEIVRAALAVRELRRSTGSARFRNAIFGELDVLDIAQVDTLEVVVTLDGARMREVAQALRVDPSTATRSIARLEALGLVERRPDPADRRSVVAVATGAGRELLDGMRSRAVPMLDALYGRFDDDELTMLADLLERLVAGADELVWR